MNRLRQLRTEKRLTIRELGNQTNISYPTISTMENEVRPFTQDNLQILCNFFNVSADYLLGLSDIRNPEIDTKPDKISFALHGYEDDLTDDDKDMILNLAKRLAENNKK